LKTPQVITNTIKITPKNVMDEELNAESEDGRRSMQEFNKRRSA